VGDGIPNNSMYDCWQIMTVYDSTVKCCLHGTCSRVYETAGRPSVGPSVCLLHRSTAAAARAAGLLLSAVQARDIGGQRRGAPVPVVLCHRVSRTYPGLMFGGVTPSSVHDICMSTYIYLPWNVELLTFVDFCVFLGVLAFG